MLLVSLWVDYNRYLAHLIAHIPPSQLDMPCRIGAREPVTLGFLASYYFTICVLISGKSAWRNDVCPNDLQIPRLV